MSGQRGELMDREIRSRLGLRAGHARLRQLAFGLAQLELGIEARGDAARDVDDVLTLRFGAFGDVRQCIFTI